MTVKPLIKLYDADGLGVIILHPSGVIYSNQVGGYACLQPEIEGVYVPLVSELIDQEKILREYFTGAKWAGWCMNGIDSDDADVIDSVLDLWLMTSFIKVDRSRLHDSCEAWIYVDIARQPDERPIIYRSPDGVGTTASGKVIQNSDYDLDIMVYPMYGFGKCNGVLTWSNSD